MPYVDGYEPEDDSLGGFDFPKALEPPWKKVVKVVGVIVGLAALVGYGVWIGTMQANINELKKLEDQYGLLPPTVESITANGRHLYFEWPAQPVRNSTGKVAPGCDIRGEGGYVLAWPSVHPSGRAYAWSVDSAKTFAAAPRSVLYLSQCVQLP